MKNMLEKNRKFITDKKYMKDTYDELCLKISESNLNLEGPEYTTHYAVFKTTKDNSSKNVIEIIPQKTKLKLSVRLPEDIILKYDKITQQTYGGNFGNGNSILVIEKGDNLDFALKTIKWSLDYILGGEKLYSNEAETLDDYQNITKGRNNEMNNDNKKYKTNPNFYTYLINKSYIFAPEIVENFLLSLRVKPFVILTGNSGTGKTKLAQLFAEYCFNKEIPTEELSKEYVTVFTKINNQLPKNQGTPSACQFYNILPYTKFEVDAHIKDKKEATAKLSCTLNARIQQVKPEAKEYINNLKNSYFDECIPIHLDAESIEKCYSDNKLLIENNIFKLNRNSNSHEKNSQWSGYPKDMEFHPITEYAKGVGIGELYTPFQLELKHKISLNERSEEFTKEIEKLRENEKIELELDFTNFNNKTFDPNYEKTKLPIHHRYEVIPVGADWTDNRNILGYENIITNSYHSTPALELILRAKEDLKHPYFLILDEMNLSHIERYFADFLSAIESKEPITLYNLKESSEETLEGDKHCERHDGCYNKKIINNEYSLNINGFNYKVPQKLEIPPNLFIIGTVNVDETTYMFSPKVLDRANVLEFETYSIDKYMNHKFDDESSNYNPILEDILNEKTYRLLEIHNNLKDMNISDLEKILNSKDKELWKKLSDELSKFQLILKESSFDFGFRVTNEILRYIVASLEYGSAKKWEEILDYQIKQKILPKLHGSENVIGETLENLIKLTYYGSEIEFTSESKELFRKLQDKKLPKNEDGAKYKNSTKKLLQMKKTLDKQRYMSFIN